MLKKSYQILDIFLKNPTATYLFADIKNHIGSKSESYTFESINLFVSEGILTKEKKGGLSFYKVSESPKALSFLSMAAEFKAWKNEFIPKDIISKLIENVGINFFSLLVVGSYAKNKQTKKSDLDVVIIVPADAKKISSRLHHFCEMSIPKIDLHVFTMDEFKDMLLDQKHNFGKEAVLNNFVFFGTEAYYKLLFEVMKRGFSY